MADLADKHASSPAEGYSQEQVPIQDNVSSEIRPPTQLDVLRYRYHHGANLGGIFVLEKWLYGSMFEPEAKGGSELDAVSASIAVRGVDATREKWEAHWSSALSDHPDLDFLAAYCTSVRLPIGFFTLGRFFTAQTPFHGEIFKVYDNAWAAVKILCSRLHKAGIGTLIDLHALPGGANDQLHSGTSSGKAELWGNSGYLNAARRCVQFIATEVKYGQVPGCIGIQLCNEAEYGARGMYDWYTDVIKELSLLDSSIPVYISDAWDLDTALTWASKHNSTGTSTCPIFVDTHKYYTFSEADKAQSPHQIIARIPSELSEVASRVGDVFGRGATEAVVGEWSCVLDRETWAKVDAANRETLLREFGDAQCQQWRKNSAGSFYWTAKMDWMDGGEWGFFEMTKKRTISPPPELLLSFDAVRTRIDQAMQQRESLRTQAYSAHEEYWTRVSPKNYFEHWRYGIGWDLGFSDAQTFFGMRANGSLPGPKMGGDSIGALDGWIRKRAREGGIEGDFAWEWEQGFRQGVRHFEGCAGIGNAK
ncbi:MAG: hypothetical protein Q9187_002654 [Circinaria calcarea]